MSKDVKHIISSLFVIFSIAWVFVSVFIMYNNIQHIEYKNAIIKAQDDALVEYRKLFKEKER